MPLDQAQIDRNLKIWWQTMEATHEMILAGLRMKIGPDGDLHSAYRQWYRQQRELASQRLDREAEQHRRRQIQESDQ